MTAPARPPTSEERWAAAAHLGSGIRDAGFAARRRRVYAVLFPLLGAFVVAIALIPILTRLVDLDFGPELEPPEWVSTLNLILLGGAVALIVWGFVRQYRLEGTAIEIQQGALAVLSPGERRSARRQISGEEPLDASHEEILVAVARAQLIRARAAGPMTAGLIIVVGSPMVSSGPVIAKVLQSVLVILMVIVVVITVVRYRRAAGFLRRESGEMTPTD